MTVGSTIQYRRRHILMANFEETLITSVATVGAMAVPDTVVASVQSKLQTTNQGQS